METRGSAKSKVSRIFTAVGKHSKERMPAAPLPLSNLNEGIVGWEHQDDPDMPLNFPRSKKWLIVGLVAAATLCTPFASSILSPGIEAVDEQFDNSNTIVGAMTVSIYLLGYTVGPLFLAPLSEIYGRKPILAASNIFFCVWQIGCALAPNISSLIVFRFFAGVGGAGCLVSISLPALCAWPALLTDWNRPLVEVLSVTSSLQTREVLQWAFISLVL